MGNRGLWNTKGLGSLRWNFGIREEQINLMVTVTTLTITLITIAIAIIRPIRLKKSPITVFNLILITIIFLSLRSKEIVLIHGLITTMAV